MNALRRLALPAWFALVATVGVPVLLEWFPL